MKLLFAGDENQRAFVFGFLSGGTLIAMIWGASGWLHTGRTPAEAAFYDRCLVAQSGNTVACDALMRIYKRTSSPPA
jgi:hypothetical protein